MININPHIHSIPISTHSNLYYHEGTRCNCLYLEQVFIPSLGPCYTLRRWKGRSRRTSSPWFGREQGLLIQILSRLLLSSFQVGNQWMANISGPWIHWCVLVVSFISPVQYLISFIYSKFICSVTPSQRLTSFQVSSSKEGPDSDFQKHIVDVGVHITIVLSFSHLHARLKCSSRRHSTLGKLFLLVSWIH